MNMFLLQGSKVALLTCVMIHFFIQSFHNWTKQGVERYQALSWNIAQGIAYLLYPMLGWIADVRVTQYKMIRLSFIFVLTSSFFQIVYVMVTLLKPNFLIQQNNLVYFINIAFTISTFMIGIGGLGLFESNAIQFGMDRMLESSSEELSSFIHWYYWSVHFGQLISYYLLAAVIAYMQNCQFNLDGPKPTANYIFSWMILFPSLLQIILAIIGLLIIIKSKNHLYIDNTHINPLQNIFKVLQYAWKNKYPVNRSAFTYWENDVPSRIDLSKHKYGGPITNEQVEDVKTLLQLLLLIMSLFGFQLSGDGFTFSQYMMYYFGCPKMWYMFLLLY